MSPLIAIRSLHAAFPPALPLRACRHMARRGLVFALVCLLASGCGFQLRGEDLRQGRTLPPVQLQIDRARTPLATAVAGAIRDADIERAPVAGSAPPAWRVRIFDQEEHRRSRTLTRGIQVAEYELTVGLDFEVLDAAGQALHPTQRLSASRVYEREQENLLTNEAEEEVLLDELRRDVAAQLVAALSVQLDGRNVAPASTSPPSPSPSPSRDSRAEPAASTGGG